ncbi:addiction module toxin RelE [Inquilinus sp. Marseille-Q2685]|uniref:addiction module toxin RelE n=1 Tax=Inquilinus sp. Marseille-Q2685 TaxID=2866581 RepID=UPI001CE4B560|nr:addiction module toxin RelE [Inquilinus sp. Marseille-Q2685]
MHSVVETPIFTRRADALLSPEDRADLITILALTPRAGALIPGLGGIRKMRFAPLGRGKSGAFRVIYYLLDDDTPVLALLLYGKNEQINPSAEQRRVMLRLVEMLKDEARKRRGHGRIDR